MGVIESIKVAAELAKKIGNLDVQQQLIEAQQQALDLLDEQRRLRGQVDELQQQLKTRGLLRFHENFYWLAGEDGREEGPFCSGCYDAKDQLVRLHGFGEHFGCPACRTVRRARGEPTSDVAVLRRFNFDKIAARQ